MFFGENFEKQYFFHIFAEICYSIQHYVFNIRGNNYRLVVVIKFTISRLFIRFVGTHSEYDKIDCSNI